MKRTPLMLCVLWVVQTGCASYSPTVKHNAVGPGKEILIGEFGYWKRDCTSRPFEYKIKQKPRFGTLRYEIGSLSIPANPEFGKAENCANKLIESKKIIYVAGPVFRVNDRVSFSVPDGNILGRKIYDVEIIVK